MIFIIIIKTTTEKLNFFYRRLPPSPYYKKSIPQSYNYSWSLQRSSNFEVARILPMRKVPVFFEKGKIFWFWTKRSQNGPRTAKKEPRRDKKCFVKKSY